MERKVIFIRLWHVDIIPYLPNSQLIAQWRELNSIFKKQDKHILINYIYDYDKAYLLDYTTFVLNEMHKRNIKHRESLITIAKRDDMPMLKAWGIRVLAIVIAVLVCSAV